MSTINIELSDKSLFQQARVGDALAFETLFRRHSVQQAEWAKKQLCKGSQDDADELIQWAFWLTYKNLHYAGDPDMSFVDIIRRTACDIQLIRHHEFAKTLHNFVRRISADWIRAAAWSNLDIEEILRRQKELSRLRYDCRTDKGLSRLFQLADGMSVSAIAVNEGVSEADVKRTIKNAAAALRQFLEP